MSSNIRHNGLWVTKGRLGFRMNEMFSYAELPVVMPGTGAAVLNLINAKDTLWRSRSSAWITNGKKFPERFSNSCYEPRSGSSPTFQRIDLPCEEDVPRPSLPS